MKKREAFINAGFKHWLSKAGDRLIRFYELTDQPEKARAWREKIKPKLPDAASDGVK